MTLSHPPGGRLALLSARPAVTFPAEECHRSSAGTELYCFMTEPYGCEQLAQGCCLEADRPRFEPSDLFDLESERSTVTPYRTHCDFFNDFNYSPDDIWSPLIAVETVCFYTQY